MQKKYLTFLSKSFLTRRKSGEGRVRWSFKIQEQVSRPQLRVKWCTVLAGARLLRGRCVDELRGRASDEAGAAWRVRSVRDGPGERGEPRGEKAALEGSRPRRFDPREPSTGWCRRRNHRTRSRIRRSRSYRFRWRRRVGYREGRNNRGSCNTLGRVYLRYFLMQRRNCSYGWTRNKFWMRISGGITLTKK